MKRKWIALGCTALLALTMSACSGEPELTPEQLEAQQVANDYMEQLESGDASLNAYEKRTLALLEGVPPQSMELELDDSYQIEMPFDAEALTFTSDDDSIASVSDDGVITPVSDGSCMVHTDADGLQFHTVVTVANTGKSTVDDTDVYEAYTAEGFDADTIKRDIETYATSKCGFTVVDTLSEDESAESDDYPFSFEYQHPGVNVKYKLLTVVDSLQEQGYKQISVSAQATSDEIVCQFFYR